MSHNENSFTDIGIYDIFVSVFPHLIGPIKDHTPITNLEDCPILTSSDSFEFPHPSIIILDPRSRINS
jgi:hypothetical protein